MMASRMLTAVTAAVLLVTSPVFGQEAYGARHVTPQEAATNSVLVWADPQQVIRWEEGSGIAGMPILLKDNIETADMPTTAGSLALVDNAPGRDAPLVGRLRDAGAVILGKTNLSEWANIRSSNSTSGWSAVGGLTRNPHALDRNNGGSSSGHGEAEREVGRVVLAGQRAPVILEQRDLRGRRALALVVGHGDVAEPVQRVGDRAVLHPTSILNTCAGVSAASSTSRSSSSSPWTTARRAPSPASRRGSGRSGRRSAAAP